MKIHFDYHVNFAVAEEEENNDFRVKVKLILDESKLMDLNIHIKMTKEMSGKLTASYKFDLSSQFNYLISSKREQGTNEIE